MVTYNKHKTAYSREHLYGTDWYLLPRGRTVASFIMLDGIYLSPSRTNSGILVDFITQKDREMLLEAHDAGVLNIVWNRLQGNLEGRREREQTERRKKANEIVDKYLGY